MVNKYMVKIILGLGIALFASNVLALTITVTADRQPVHINESFKLIFEADGSVDVEPDFGPFELYFKIMNRSQSQNIQYINGTLSRKTQWVLTLIPKQKGNITLPVIDFGQAKSPNVTLQVEAQKQHDESQAANMFLDVEVSTHRPYVQSEVMYTVRFSRAVNIANASLRPPEFDDNDVIVEQVGEDSEYETILNGRRYVVFERQYALFPQKSGQVHIEPVTFEVQIAQSTRGFPSLFNQSVRTEILTSESVKLEVRDIPKTFTGKYWLPARALNLKEVWPGNSQTVRAGEPITRSLIMTAEGVSAAQLPEINIQLPDGIKAYPDQPVLSEQKTGLGFIAKREEKIAMIPAHEGSIELPAIEVHWWNVETDRPEVTRVKRQTLKVLAAENTTHSLVAETENNNMASDINNGSRDVALANGNSNSYWPWLTLFFALAWVVTFFAWYKKPRHDGVDRKNNVDKSDVSRTIEKNLKRACDSNHPAQARKYLLQWAQHNGLKGTGLTSLVNYLGKDMEQTFNDLEQVLYANNKQSWSGGALWQEFGKGKKHRSGIVHQTETVIAALNP